MACRKKHDKSRHRCAQAGISVFYDESGAVGRRYRRMDEAGTPFCITVDGETLANDTVTVRERDSMAQVKISVTEILPWLQDKLKRPGA
jgi:glycyl-tRNA synthetase